MSIPQKQTTERTLPPEGLHPARLVGMVHIGTIETEWEGNKKMSDKTRFTFELPTKTHVFSEEKGPEPFSVSRTFSSSLYSRSATRPVAESLIGAKLTDEEAKHFDIMDLVGKECMVQIMYKEYNGSKYASLEQVTQVPEGLTVPDSHRPIFKFDYNENFSESFVDNMPEFLQKQVMSSQEYQAHKKLKDGVGEMPATSDSDKSIHQDDFNAEDIQM